MQHPLDCRGRVQCTSGVQVPFQFVRWGKLPTTTIKLGLTWYQIEAEGTQQEEVETVIVVLEHGFRCLVWVSRDQTLAGSKSGSPGPKTICIVFHVELAALAMGRAGKLRAMDRRNDERGC